MPEDRPRVQDQTGCAQCARRLGLIFRPGPEQKSWLSAIIRRLEGIYRFQRGKCNGRPLDNDNRPGLIINVSSAQPLHSHSRKARARHHKVSGKAGGSGL